MALTKLERRNRIRMRIRKKVSGTTDVPRLAIFRSNSSIYAQVIDDTTGKTLVASSVKALKDYKGTKSEISIAVGKEIAEKALKAGITKVVFDRGGYLYHGRVKSLAEAAREGGLKF
ncbi:MAG: 50S ribosomal protein L18 [Luteibaculaceae bacterium]